MNANDELLVFFTEDETVGIKPIRKYAARFAARQRMYLTNHALHYYRRICERMVSQSIMKGILIYQKNLTPSANKVDELGSEIL